MTDQEQWRPVPGFDAHYEVSDHGRVRSLDRYLPQFGRKELRLHRGRILRAGTCPGGHQLVMLGRGNPMNVHILVLNAFVGPAPKGMWCRHLDDNPANNHLSNLCWGTVSENVMDAVKNNKRGRDKATGRFTSPRGDQ